MAISNDWISCAKAVSELQKILGVNAQAQREIAKRAYAGLIKARAQTLIIHADALHLSEAREDIPVAKEFWKDALAGVIETEQDWQTGTFTLYLGKGASRHRWDAFGVQFDSVDIQKAIRSMKGGAKIAANAIKPPLSGHDLEYWYNNLSAEEKDLPQTKLEEMAKSNFPEHSVTRVRVRALAPGRKPGPKPFGGKETA